ncbi:MAG TPA: KH domain-containing protein [Candidatus Babeliales bacterium]|nr:KH domain-containing protein [Candidatus Babeliales bacterium]
MIRELVIFVVQQLVLYPQDVIVTFTEKEDIDLLEIRVASEDRGRVIGKEGHTIKSIRALIDAAMPNHKKKIMLELSR